jgi:hypothetical protein
MEGHPDGFHILTIHNSNDKTADVVASEIEKYIKSALKAS